MAKVKIDLIDGCSVKQAQVVADSLLQTQRSVVSSSIELPKDRPAARILVLEITPAVGVQEILNLGIEIQKLSSLL